MQWQEGRSGDHATFRERLVPAWWVFLVGAAFAATFGIAYGHTFGAGVGWALGLSTAAVSCAALFASSPVVSVDDRVLRAGPARLPLFAIGRVAELDRDQSRRARTVDADPRAHLLLRTWRGPGTVLVEVVDRDDPHPYWLVTSKRPARLAGALRAAVDRARLSAAPAFGRSLDQADREAQA